MIFDCGSSRNEKTPVIFDCGSSRNEKAPVISDCGFSRNEKAPVISDCGFSRNEKALVISDCGFSRNEKALVISDRGSSRNEKALVISDRGSSRNQFPLLKFFNSQWLIANCQLQGSKAHSAGCTAINCKESQIKDSPHPSLLRSGRDTDEQKEYMVKGMRCNEKWIVYRGVGERIHAFTPLRIDD